jgi:O-antigen/teichoic acid export membrane protein
MSEVVHDSLKKAVKGTTLVFFGTVVGLLFWFFSKILIVRTTTPEEFGIYSLALAITSIVGVVASGGLSEGASRNVALFLGEGRQEDADAASRSAIRLTLLAGLLSFSLLFLLAGPLSRYVFYKPELMSPMRVLSIHIPFLLLAQILSGILRAHGIIRPKVYYLDLGQPLFFLFFLCLSMIPGVSLGSILYSFSLAMVMVFIGIASYGYRKVGLNPLPRRRGRHSVRLLRFSLPLMAVVIMALVLTWTDTLMLGRYAMAEDVGIYNVSVSLARLLSIPLASLGFVFMPLAAEMYALKKQDELKRTYQVLTKWLFATTLPIFFVLVFFPEMTIAFLFGESFAGASTPLRLLCVGRLLSVFLGPSGLFLVVFGLSRTIMNVSLFGALLNIVLNYVLIKRLGMGIMGAAAATMVAGSVVTVLFAVVVYRKSRIHPITAAYVKPALGAALTGLAVYALVKTLPVFSLWLMPAHLVLFLIGYAASLLLTRSIEREDVAMFEAISRRTGVRIEFLERFLRRRCR